MTHPPILVVDENDNPIGEADMLEAQKKGLYHRIVRVMIEDEQGRILLQKRSSRMINSPNMWDHSAAGHVDVGETNEQAAVREAKEEIGLEGIKLRAMGTWKSNRKLSDGRVFNRFNLLFRGKAGAFVPQINEHEVAEVKWYTLDEIKLLIKEHPDQVTGGLAHAIKHFY